MSSSPIASKSKLSLNKITKRYGNITANDSISITIEPGKIHALLGENGAGKSTLVSILYGLVQPNSGTIQLDGQEIQLRHPIDAIHNGIAMVQQHMSLIEDFTVLENLMLGQEQTSPFGLSKQQAVSCFEDLSNKYHLDLPLQSRLGDLPVGIQQRVEIAKALSRNPKIIIFDEPTAALVTHEIDSFIGTMQTLRDQGMAVIFITHRLHEVMRCADSVTVLRQGKVVLEQKRDELNQSQIAEAIIGELSQDEQYSLPTKSKTILQMSNICSIGSPPIQNINLELHQSQIMGIAGVAGNGQDTLINTLMGITKSISGSITLLDQSIETKRVAQRREMGLTLIPQDRRRHALLTSFPIWENILLNRNAAQMNSNYWMNSTSIQNTANTLISDYKIKASSPHASVSSLSGGHQQRVITARELSTKPKVIIAYDPTRGLDIRASRFVHKQLIKAAEEGTAVLLFSSELSELILLCHDIAVIHNGNLSPPQAKENWTQESLGHAMTGGSE